MPMPEGSNPGEDELKGLGPNELAQARKYASKEDWSARQVEGDTEDKEAAEANEETLARAANMIVKNTGEKLPDELRSAQKTARKEADELRDSLQTNTDIRDANLWRSEQHFRKDEEGYKEQAIKDAREAVSEAHPDGIDVKYPPYTDETPPEVK
ncbi:MAG TPA: hypothetical protein VLE72_00845 [Candidatus Saccharimonadales bacterium]|nr:hypothetical protein [Candidatus Saccharimonadales bacterium]